MIGAMIGDIVGSVYEWHNIKTKDFPFFSDNCFPTDDSIMTLAVAEALMAGGGEDQLIDSMKDWGKAYPGAGYGTRFGEWLRSQRRVPYNSWGNGAAMRVSPCAQLVYHRMYQKEGYEKSVVETLRLAVVSAEVTHNHPEGIKGAEAAAYAQLLAHVFGPEEAKARIRKDIPALFGYDLSHSLDQIRPGYQFNETCQQTVPEAITAFLESSDFEDAIRNAISLGGDSDTLAAITGGMAEAAYGVPEDIKAKALSFLDERQRALYDRWELFLQQ